MSKMLKSSGAMGAATLTSRVLGLVRELVYAGFMGAGPEASAFFLAFAIPNLFRRLLGEGVLTAVFIPIFKTKEKTEGTEAMWRATNAIISGLLLITMEIVLVALLVIWIVLKTAPLDPETRLMLQLTQVMVPYLILACLGAVFMGILNARGHFFIPALGAAILNIFMIASVLFLAPHMGKSLEHQIFALAIGVLAAGIAQALFQVPSMKREGFRYHWISPWKNETVREVVRKMIPSSIGVAAFQINFMITQGLAFGHNKSIVSQFSYAVRLMELPQGVFGISLATFLLPTLSALAIEKNYHEFRSTLRQGMSHLIFINLLAAALLFTLAEPIIRLLFEHGKFHADATQSVSFALVYLAPGLIAFSLVNIFARAFYALSDMKTPMYISLFCLTVNVLFTVLFLYGFELGAGSLGLANTLSSLCNICLLIYALRKKLKTLEMTELLQQLSRLIAATVSAGLVAWSIRLLWQNHLGHHNFLLKLGEVFAPILTATAAYFALTLWLKIPSAHEIINLVTARLRKRV